MDFHSVLDLAGKDFKKFLKTVRNFLIFCTPVKLIHVGIFQEFVAPMHLKVHDYRNEQQGVTIVRYVWGVRAELEFSKWNIFKQAIRVSSHSLFAG